MVCTSCQKDIPAGSNFCCSCGAKQPEAARPPASQAYGAPRRRLTRSINDRKIGGVCAGIADYFDLDPTLVRVLWLLLLLLGGTGGLAYIICWLVLPEGYTGTVQTSQTAP